MLGLGLQVCSRMESRGYVLSVAYCSVPYGLYVNYSTPHSPIPVIKVPLFGGLCGVNGFQVLSGFRNPLKPCTRHQHTHGLGYRHRG